MTSTYTISGSHSGRVLHVGASVEMAAKYLSDQGHPMPEGALVSLPLGEPFVFGGVRVQRVELPVEPYNRPLDWRRA